MWISECISQQTIQLATLVILDQTLQEVIDNNNEGLDELLTNIQSLIQTLYCIIQRQPPTDVKPLSNSQLLTDTNNDSSILLHAEDSFTEEGRERRGEVERRETMSPQGEEEDKIAESSKRYLYEQLMFILVAYRDRINQLLKEDDSLSSSFMLESLIRYKYASKERTVCLSSLGVALNYGFHYSGGCSLSLLAPPTERAVVYLLKIMSQRLAGLIVDHSPSQVQYTIHVHTSFVHTHVYMCMFIFD